MSEGDDDRDDEPGGDLDAVGPLDDIGDGRVDEDQGDRREGHPFAIVPVHKAQCHRQRRRRHQHEHSGGIGAALRRDVGVEDDRDEERDAGEQRHERPRGARPFWRHPIPRQVPGTRFRSPAMADAPANHRMAIVLTS
jgi:hypothetical protein